MSIFLSRSKAWCNTTTGACTCPERNTYCTGSSDTRAVKGVGEVERKQKLWHSPQTYVSLSFWGASFVCWLYKTIPHSIPWHLAGAPVSCRRQTCGTGSWLDTWGSNLCHSHWRAQLLCRGRTGLSHSPVGRGYWWVRPLMSKYWPQMAAESDVQFRYYWHRLLSLCFPFLWRRILNWNQAHYTFSVIKWWDLWVHSSNATSPQSHWNQSSPGSRGITLTNLWCQGYYISPSPASRLTPPSVLQWPALHELTIDDVCVDALQCCHTLASVLLIVQKRHLKQSVWCFTQQVCQSILHLLQLWLVVQDISCINYLTDDNFKRPFWAQAKM